MRRLMAGAVGLIALGIALLAYAVSSGEATAYIFLFIPVFQGSSLSAFAGTMLLFAGIFLFFISMATPLEYGPVKPSPHAQPQNAGQPVSPPPPSKKFGGVVFLGPFPIIFGSDKKIAKWMIVAAFVLVILLVIVLWYFTTQHPR